MYLSSRVVTGSHYGPLRLTVDTQLGTCYHNESYPSGISKRTFKEEDERVTWVTEIAEVPSSFLIGPNHKYVIRAEVNSGSRFTHRRKTNQNKTIRGQVSLIGKEQCCSLTSVINKSSAGTFATLQSVGLQRCPMPMPPDVVLRILKWPPSPWIVSIHPQNPPSSCSPLLSIPWFCGKSLPQ